MNILYQFKPGILTAILLLLTTLAFSQARSNVGIGISANKTFADGFTFGNGLNLQGSIRLNNKLAITPALGYETLHTQYAIIYEGLSSYTRDDIAMLYWGLGVKYHFNNSHWFAKAGALLYLNVQGDGPEDGGIGGTAAFGYDLPLNKRSDLELSSWTDVIKIRHDVTPVAGLRLAYNFNFRKL